MWNYRVVKGDTDSPCYSIYEVHYTKSGKISGWCETGLSNWENVRELKGTVHLISKAFQLPILKQIWDQSKETIRLV